MRQQRSSRNRGWLRAARHGLLAGTVAVGAAWLAGCNNDDTIVFPTDGVPPHPPQAVASLTLDGSVDLSWVPNTEDDLEGYRIYRSYFPDRGYGLVAEKGPRVEDDGFVHYEDRDLTNGTTYYYGITAFDDEGLESDFNADLIFDTPRREGVERIFNVEGFPRDSGYDFSREDVVPWDDDRADIYYEYTTEYGYLVYAADGATDIQDMGYTGGFDEIGWAPPEGWSNNGWVEAIEGHTYVVWTRDDHYAKFRIDDLANEFIDIFWAYQPQQSNQELDEQVTVERKVVP